VIADDNAYAYADRLSIVNDRTNQQIGKATDSRSLIGVRRPCARRCH